MTDYSNMSRGEAVERCIGLEIEREIDQRLGNHMIAQNKKLVHTLEGYDKRIAELERDAARLVEALQLAANRLDSLGLWQPVGSIEYRLGRDWSEEAMLSIAAYRKEVQS